MAEPYAANLPAQIQTVGDLSRVVSLECYIQRLKARDNWSLKESELLLRSIIAEEVRVPLKEVKLETRLVEDLNLD